MTVDADNTPLKNFAHRVGPDTIDAFPFQPGDEVFWLSQAGGHTTGKRGTVIYVGRREDFGFRRLMLDNAPNLFGARCGKWLEDAKERFIGASRNCLQFDVPASEGVIVEVKRFGARGQPLNSWFYSPRVKGLEKAPPEQ